MSTGLILLSSWALLSLFTMVMAYRLNWHDGDVEGMVAVSTFILLLAPAMAIGICVHLTKNAIDRQEFLSEEIRLEHQHKMRLLKMRHVDIETTIKQESLKESNS